MSSKCLICNSSKLVIIRKTLRHNIKRDVLKCQRCAFVFLKPRKKNSVNFYKDNAYRKKYGPNLNRQNNPKIVFNTYFPFQSEISSEIKRILRREMNILDVGCSTGHFLESLRGKVKNRVGLELNVKEANYARKTLGLKVYTEPVESANITEAPFDLITILQVLEHIENPISFLTRLREILKPDGYIYVEVPNLDDVLLSVYDVKAYSDFYYREAHISYFSPKTLALLMKKSGFRGEIKTVQRYNVLNHMNWILKAQPQDSFAIGNSTPILAKNSTSKTAFILNRFITKMNEEYKAILSDNGIGETISFLGKISK